MKKRIAVLALVAWCTLVATPPYLSHNWLCRVLPWAFSFPGKGWTP